jgi:hypothetical protein
MIYTSKSILLSNPLDLCNYCTKRHNCAYINSYCKDRELIYKELFEKNYCDKNYDVKYSGGTGRLK